MSILVTAGPITADAATAKVVGIKKTFTVSASATNKVTGLSKAEKKVVKVTKKGKKFTIKGLKAGKATFKIGKKSYTVKVGATTVKAAKTKLTLTKGKAVTLKFTTKSGNGDTLTFKASNKNVTLAKKSAKIAKSAASVKATAKKAGKTTITATSKATGKKATVTVTVKNAAKPATTTPGASNTPVATATGSATNTPEATATATATATASGSATNTPDVTATPVATATGTATATPVATGSATSTPEATEVPTEAPTKAPEVVTGGTITVNANVSGASIKVVSGTTVVATDSTTKVPNGTYTLVVTKEGYKEVSKIVTVNGDITVDVVLEKVDALELTSLTAVNTQDEEVALTNVPASASLVFKFNQAVKEESVNVNNIRIYEKDTNVPVSFATNAITVSADKTTVKVDLPVNTIDKGTTYKVVAKDIVTDSGLKLAETTNTFTVSKMAVVTDTTYDFYDFSASDNGTTTSFTNNIKTDDAADTITKVSVEYDDILNTSSFTTANVSLTDVKTGKKLPITMAVNVSATTTNVDVIPTAGFENGKQYILTVGNGGLTAVGNAVEAYTTVFAIQATDPMSGQSTLNGSAATVKTLDNKPMGTNSSSLVWPLLTSGMKETASTDEYRAGLNIQIKTIAKWDAASIDENVQLIEKESGNVVATTMSYNSDAQILSIVPKADLKESTTYVIQFKGGLKTDLGIYLNAAKKDKAVTAFDYAFKTMDVTAPTVTEITSADGLVDLKREEDHSFVVTLGEDIDLTTKTTAVVIAKTSVKNDDGTTFSGILSSASYTITKVTGKDNQYVIKIPKETLERNEAYKIMIVGKDIAETAIVKNSGSARTVLTDGGYNRLAKTYTIAFTTEGEDVTGPVVKSVYKGQKIDADNVVASSGAINVVKNDYFTFEFNEKINSSVTSGLFTLQQNISGVWTDVPRGIADVTAVEKVAGSSEYYGVKVQLYNDNTNLADAKYRIVLSKGAVKDVASHPNELAEDYTFEFIGSAEDDTAAVVKVGKITTSTFNAATDDTKTDVDSLITIGFAESEIVEIPDGAIKVTDAAGNVVAGKLEEVTGTINHFTDAKRYTFTPAKDLAYDTTYTVTVDGVYDFIGNKIEKKQYQFKTVAEALKVSSVSVADKATNVDLQKTITIGLNSTVKSLNSSAAAETAGDTDVTVTLTKDGGSDLISASNGVTASIDKKTISIKFNGAADGKLDANSKYTLVVSAKTSRNGGSYDGDATELKNITFTTGMTATDDVKPSIATDGLTMAGTTENAVATKLTADVINNLTTLNSAQNANAAINSDIIVQFTEKIKKDNVKVTIIDITNSNILPTALNITAANDTLTVSTLGIKSDSTDTFKVVISGVEDEAGNVADDIVFYLQK